MKANDPHFDAKCFPCVHPWGTGSLLAEPGSGSAARYVRNRATNIESFIRRSDTPLFGLCCRAWNAFTSCPDALAKEIQDCDLVLLEA